MAATFGGSREWIEFATQNPIVPDRGTVSGRVLLDGKVIHVRDVLVDQEFTGAGYYVYGTYRTSLGVPLSTKEKTVGVFVIARAEVREFTEKQIKLVTTFADQAVIAIENARLLKELRQRTDDLTGRTADLTEALEQQTATSEVLQVISSSPGDLEPVFSTMLENAVRICGATFGNIYRRDGGAFRIVTSHNAPAAFVEALKQYPYISGKRMVATKSPIHVADATAQPFYTEGRDPEAVAAIELGGVRTFLAVPMLKDGEVIGAFLLNRQEVRPFTDKQIELVKNFAAQAVIAIENARLLNELRKRTDDLTERTADLTEALEQQTATSEVLKVISSSPGELQPVFDAMLDKAVRICRADAASLFLYENGIVRRAARHSGVADVTMPIAPSAKSGTMRSIATKQTIHIANYLADPTYLEGDDFVVAAAQRLGIRASLHVPMLREQEVVGAFTIWRMEALAFTEKQIELVTNFAAQAVIAIENARLLGELRQRTTDLTEALDQQTQRQRYCRLLVAPQVIFIQCSQQSWRTPRGFAKPILEMFICGMVMPFI